MKHSGKAKNMSRILYHNHLFFAIVFETFSAFSQNYLVLFVFCDGSRQYGGAYSAVSMIDSGEFGASANTAVIYSTRRLFVFCCCILSKVSRETRITPQNTRNLYVSHETFGAKMAVSRET